MNIKAITFLLIAVLLLQTKTEAQQSYQLGVLPSININKAIKNGWALNFKVESRTVYESGLIEETPDRGLEYILTDFSFLTSKKVSLNNAIAAGYLIRVEDEKLTHRTIQQFTIVKQQEGYRMSHRFLADQTFTSGHHPEFRLRYRITGEVPLSGQSVDPREFYLKANNEYLNSWENREYDLEIRFVPLLGYEFTDNNKLEVGLDYRVNSFLIRKSKNSFWFNINWFIKIG